MPSRRRKSSRTNAGKHSRYAGSDDSSSSQDEVSVVGVARSTRRAPLTVTVDLSNRNPSSHDSSSDDEESSQSDDSPSPNQDELPPPIHPDNHKAFIWFFSIPKNSKVPSSFFKKTGEHEYLSSRMEDPPHKFPGYARMDFFTTLDSYEEICETIAEMVDKKTNGLYRLCHHSDIQHLDSKIFIRQTTEDPASETKTLSARAEENKLVPLQNEPRPISLERVLAEHAYFYSSPDESISYLDVAVVTEKKKKRRSALTEGDTPADNDAAAAERIQKLQASTAITIKLRTYVFKNDKDGVLKS